MPGSLPPLQVLYEDNHLLVVNKPAGIPTMGAKAGTHSLVMLAKEYLKRKYQKPGNVYVGVVSRLDAPVSGVLVLARTSKAAARLAEQFRERDPQKVYWAIVEGTLGQATGKLVHWIVKDEARRRMTVRSKQTAGTQEAKLRYRSPAVPASVTRRPDGFALRLDAPAFGVAPGQIAVLYADEAIVGSGVIISAAI